MTNTKLAEALAQFEAALLFAYPEGARGAAFDCWNKARQALAAHEAEQAAFGAWFQGYRHGWKSEKDVTFDAWQARAALAQRQPLTLDAFDEYDLCNSFAGLPVEWFNPGPSFGATTGEQNK